MSALDSFLSHLHKVKKTGHDRWTALCPAHPDKNPSLHIREKDDGIVLIHCQSGCGGAEVVAAVGLRLDALYPPRPPGSGHHTKRERKPFNSNDVLKIAAFEATVVFLAATDIANGKPLSEIDRARLLVAASRLNHAVEVANGY